MNSPTMVNSKLPLVCLHKMAEKVKLESAPGYCAQLLLKARRTAIKKFCGMQSFNLALCHVPRMHLCITDESGPGRPQHYQQDYGAPCRPRPSVSIIAPRHGIGTFLGFLLHHAALPWGGSHCRRHLMLCRDWTSWLLDPCAQILPYVRCPSR